MSARTIPKPLPKIKPKHGEDLYLILDGSQINDLEKLLYEIEGNPLYLPIYLNEPWRQLKEVTPCVIRANKSIYDWFISNASINQGYFFSSQADIETIADSFRSLIQVQSPYGSNVFFKMAHGEAAKILFQDKNPDIWKTIGQVWIPTRSGWYYDENPQDLHNPSGSIIILNDEQWKKLGQISWQNTLEKIENHLTKWFSESLPKVEPAWLQQEAKNAYNKGFSSERDLLLYFNVFGFLGINTLDDTRHAEIQALINVPSLETPSQRIQKASSLAEQYAMQKNTQEQAL